MMLIISPQEMKRLLNLKYPSLLNSSPKAVIPANFHDRGGCRKR